MAILRNLFLLLSGAVTIFLAVTFGIFIFAFLAIVGLLFWGYFKLRQKDIIHKMNEMGMPPSPHHPDDGQTIEAEYEVVEEENDKLK